MVKDWLGFVIKPAQGSGGKGILVTSHKDGVYTKPSGATINKEEVERHISNALAGCSRSAVRTMLPWLRT